MDTAKALRNTASVMRKGIVMGQGEAAKRLEQAADTIERLQGLNTDLELLAKKRATLLKQAKQERDKFEADYLKYYDIGHNCSIQLRHALEQRDAALAEVERLKGEYQRYERKTSAEIRTLKEQRDEARQRCVEAERLA